jgi:hypothetical protein
MVCPEFLKQGLVDPDLVFRQGHDRDKKYQSGSDEKNAINVCPEISNHGLPEHFQSGSGCIFLSRV